MPTRILTELLSGATSDGAKVQPSLRDLAQPNLDPSVETLGYFHSSLRDERGQVHGQDAGPPWGSARMSKAGAGL
jgi:hypothetical protein